MATITIKIKSDQLAREVLTKLGYLPDDDGVRNVPWDAWTDSEDEEDHITRKDELKAAYDRMMTKKTCRVPANDR